MAKSAPTILLGANPSFIVLELIFQDFRGQKVTKRITLSGSTTDNQIKAIVADIDMLSNAQIVSAKKLAETTITGMNNAPVNALERNISEVLELSFSVADPINAGKVIERSILIPAMVASAELTDGSPDTSNTSLAALVGTSGGSFIDGDLSAHLWYKDGSGVGHTAMNWVASESHHITVADIVDTA